MAAKPNPAAVLADNLVQTLKAQRSRFDAVYPLPLPQLATLAGADPATFGKAIKNKVFTTQATLAQKKNPESLVALTEDAVRLAESDALLLALLEQCCTPESPAIALDKLTKKVETPLRQALGESLARRVQSGSLPGGVAVVMVKNKPQLYLQRMPPARPADVELAEKLLAALESRQTEEGGFPWTMRSLIAHTAPTADAALLKKAFGSKLLKPRLLVAAKGDEAPIALAEDIGTLADSAGLLTFALNASRTADNQAISLADLKKKVSKGMQQPFSESLVQRVTDGRLPKGIGLLRIKKQPCFFFWSDAGGEVAKPVPPPVPSGPPTLDFAGAFEQVFDSLDRQRGGVNLVSLADLRRALPVDRAIFDRELNQLRRAGQFSLSGAEGRHGLSDAEKDAAIREGDNLLLFVARRPST